MSTQHHNRLPDVTAPDHSRPFPRRGGGIDGHHVMHQDHRPGMGVTLYCQHVGQSHLKVVQTIHKREVNRPAKQSQHIVASEEILGGRRHHSPIRMLEVAHPWLWVDAHQACRRPGKG